MGAPGFRSKSSNLTQKALGDVAESNNSTRFLWSMTVRHSVDAMLGFLGSLMPRGTLTDCMTLRTDAMAWNSKLRPGTALMIAGSTVFGMASTNHEALAKRSDALMVPGRKAAPPTPLQYSSMASCLLYVGELVMTRYWGLWWMINLPSMYSKIAESPLGSEMERWPTAGSPDGSICVRVHGRKVGILVMCAALHA